MRATTTLSLASLLAPLTAALLGCPATLPSQSNGGGGQSASGTGGHNAASSSSGGLGIGGGLAGSGGSTGSGSGDCSSAAELVYVFSEAGDIYSFNPPTKQFTKIATPNCPASGGANSMAIDRNLVAWLNYVGGIYTYDLKSPSSTCQLAISLTSTYAQCGMGFATDAVGSNSETLYIDGTNGNGGLAKVNMGSKTVQPIGNFTNDSALTGQSCELTGTGDARLFGYFTTSPNVRVAQIDKGTANIQSDNALANFSPPSAWAFTFWGGDFYLYAAPGPSPNGGTNSGVVHYSPATNTVDLSYVTDVGFTIVGAGVSTCAPLTTPK